MVLRLCAAICGAAILFAYSSTAMARLGTVNVHPGARGTTAKGYANFSTPTLLVFAIFSAVYLKNPLTWGQGFGFLLIAAGAFFVFQVPK